MAEIRNKDETSKPSNHSDREQKRSRKQHIKTLNTTAYSSHCLFNKNVTVNSKKDQQTTTRTSSYQLW